jgi:hypothetical protein
MSVCTFFLCLCCPVCRQQPCNGLITLPSTPDNCIKKDCETEGEARAEQRGGGGTATDELMNSEFSNSSKTSA